MKKENIVKLYLSNPSYYHNVVAMEELSECIKAISKIYRYGATPKNICNLMEEMADVLICFELLKLMYDISDAELELMIVTKMNRNIERIDT